MPTSDWVNRFLASCARRGTKQSSINAYKSFLKCVTNDQHLDLESCNQEQLFNALDAIRGGHSIRYYASIVKVTKRSLRFLGRKGLAEKLEVPRLPNAANEIKEQILPPEEIQKLIKEAPTSQDRLLVELLYETGGRNGELANLKIKDVQFEEYAGTTTAIVSLTGKTGTRRRRVYASVPELRQHLNNHPQRSNPNASLFLNSWGKPYNPQTIFLHIRSLGRKLLGREIHPHQFRHSKATEDSKVFTDREMMKLYGWNSPAMVGVYSHLSMRDVDDKDLILHGLKQREDALRPLVNAQRCLRCGEENAPIAVYCSKCGSILAPSSQTNMEELLSNPKFIQAVCGNRDLIEALKKELQVS
jgi:integrase/ribosomal protein L40E